MRRGKRGLAQLSMAMVLLATASCNEPSADKSPLPDPTQASPMASEAASPEPSASASPEVALDYAALDDHADPERLLRFYATAVREGQWQAAARAWTRDAQVTPEMLERAYARGGARAELVVGKGDSEGAAGTLFHVAPIVVDFPDAAGGEERRGTIVLRRANDVPGASEEQLDWRIERSDVMVLATP